MRMKGGGASKGMRGEEKEEGEDPKASADPAGNQGREGENKQREGKGWEGKGWLVTAHPASKPVASSVLAAVSKRTAFKRETGIPHVAVGVHARVFGGCARQGSSIAQSELEVGFPRPSLPVV